MGSRETASTSIHVSIFSADNRELEHFIGKNFEENQNLITYWYLPLQCQFVCQDLADDYDTVVCKRSHELGNETSSTLEVRPCGHGCGRCTTGHN